MWKLSFLAVLCAAVHVNVGTHSQDPAAHVIILTNIYHDDNDASTHGTNDEVKPHMASHRAYALLQRHAVRARMMRRHRHKRLRGTSLIQTGAEEGIEFSFWSDAKRDDFTEQVYNFRNHEYLGEIKVGSNSQKLNVVFDTGSTNTWVNSDLCDDHSCRSRRQFHPKNSSTFQRLEGGVKVFFGTAYIEGICAMDTFTLGPITIDKQRFGLITKESGQVFNAIAIEGIFGMSFAALSSFGPNSMIDNLFGSGRLTHNQFAFYLTPRGQGKSAVMFGDVSNAFYKDPLECFPVLKDDATRKFWMVAVESLHLVYPDKNQEPILFDGPSLAIFDSGTNMYSVDPKYYRSLWQHFQRCNMSNFENTLPNMPTLRFAMKTTSGDVIDIDIPPNEYMTAADTNPESEVQPGWMSVECREPDGPAYIFGQLFMHYWFTQFRHSSSSPEICVSRAVHGPHIQKILTGTDFPLAGATAQHHSIEALQPDITRNWVEDGVSQIELRREEASSLLHQTSVQALE